jgi:hypothetical protein
MSTPPTERPILPEKGSNSGRSSNKLPREQQTTKTVINQAPSNEQPTYMPGYGGGFMGFNPAPWATMPCYADVTMPQGFYPMMSPATRPPSKKAKKGRQKAAPNWSVEEDDKLVSLVEAESSVLVDTMGGPEWELLAQRHSENCGHTRSPQAIRDEFTKIRTRSSKHGSKDQKQRLFSRARIAAAAVLQKNNPEVGGSEIVDLSDDADAGTGKENSGNGVKLPKLRETNRSKKTSIEQSIANLAASCTTLIDQKQNNNKDNTRFEALEKTVGSLQKEIGSIRGDVKDGFADVKKLLGDGSTNKRHRDDNDV